MGKKYVDVTGGVVDFTKSLAPHLASQKVKDMLLSTLGMIRAKDGKESLRYTRLGLELMDFEGRWWELSESDYELVKTAVEGNGAGYISMLYSPLYAAVCDGALDNPPDPAAE